MSAAWRRPSETDLARVSERASRHSRQSRTMSVDNRLLIKQIEARPALWNRNDRDYCQKLVVSKQWAEIALIHGVHESRVKNKWKALRDTFRQELKKNPEQSSWSYYLDMQFLKGQLKMLPTAGFEENRPEEITLVKMEPEEDAANGRSDGSEGASLGVPQELEGLSPLPDEYDDDYHFLMSLLPEMRKLEPRQKLVLRIKMMELFCREAYPEDK